MPRFQSRLQQQIWLVALIVVLGGGVALRLIGFNNADAKPISHKKHPHKNSPAIKTAPVRQADIPIYISALGTVNPSQSVTVLSQVNGQLLKVFFKEGQSVKKGDLLAEIDPRPFEAQVAQYSGQLSKDAALLANAKIDLKRYKTLLAQDSVSRQTYDAQKWLVKQYEGSVQADQGQLDNANVNLGFCKITSPATGRIGLQSIDPGNYIQASNAKGLFIINTISPVSVVFTIPEDQLPEILEQLKTNTTLQVKAYDRGRKNQLATGKIEAVDNQIDPTTGTIKIKAVFANTDERLFPNQFVNIDLRLKTLKQALLVPTSAVQYGPQGPYVYIPQDNNTVRLQPITVAAAIEEDVVVSKGVTIGQKVVTEGVDKLKDGSAISTSSGTL